MYLTYLFNVLLLKDKWLLAHLQVTQEINKWMNEEAKNDLPFLSWMDPKLNFNLYRLDDYNNLEQYYCNCPRLREVNRLR